MEIFHCKTLFNKFSTKNKKLKMTKTIGIIGQGFVGTAIREQFKKTFNVKCYDKFAKDLCVTHTPGTIIDETPKNSIATLVEECNVIFVCVPTPMFEDGECDTRIVESVIEDISKEAEFQNKKVVAIIKSTVPPGTTAKLNSISSQVSVAFSPEFLTEANAINDFANQKRVVLGIDYMELIDPLTKVFEIGLPDAELIIINSNEAEMSKYATNLFLATKVSFFNDIYTFCENFNINYNNVIEATMHDPRIGKSHYMVPGPDGDRGFGGHCFPKDLSAILKIAQDLGFALPTITGANVTNLIVRQNRDWETMEGRAVSKREDKDLSVK